MQQAELISKQARSAGKEFRKQLEEYLKGRPDLERLNTLARQYANFYDENATQKLDGDLREWAFGPAVSKTSPEHVARKEDVAQLRRFMFLHEVDGLLADPETAALVKPWMDSRLQALGKSPSTETRYNQAQGYDWLLIGDAVLPDAATLQKLLTSPTRQDLITQYAAARGLGSVDATMPPGAEDYLRTMMHWTILRDAARGELMARLPPNLRNLESKAAELRAQLGRLNAVIQKPPPPVD